MKDAEIKTAIEQGKTALGVELGSTRIKAVLIGPDHAPIASGAFDWENRLETASGPIAWRMCGRGFKPPTGRWPCR